MKIIAVFLIILTLFGCGQNVPASTETETLPPVSEEVETPEEEPAEPEKAEFVFVRPPAADTPEEVLQLYFDMLYRSYVLMQPTDLSSIIDLDFPMMVNVQSWNSLLALRRKVISDEGYCYVETERFSYKIEYIKKRDLDDRRMDYIELSDYGENAKVLHFVIKGEEGKAYPPIFAVNSQHTVIFTEENGEYKIAYHYFPGSEGKFENDLPVELVTEERMKVLLRKEFTSAVLPPERAPKKARVYNSEAAVEYALSHCEERNPAFHFVGDWYGNCMNFVSQCLWSGFKTEGETPKNTGGMTKDWYCKKSGGTLIWASVSRFWGWITESDCDMEVLTFKNARNLRAGDIVNVGSYSREEPEKYTHALLVVDGEKLILAQNSPACFVYYSDLVNNYFRFIRPVSLDS